LRKEGRKKERKKESLRKEGRKKESLRKEGRKKKERKKVQGKKPTEKRYFSFRLNFSPIERTGKLSGRKSRVARLFSIQHTKMGKIYQMAIKNTRCP
jgi:hypothetical protein